MKKFSFRLQKVMELRRWHEKQSQQKMAEARREKEEAERQLREKLAEVEEHSLGQQRTTRGSFKAGDALFGHRYLQHLRRQASVKTEEVRAAEQSVDKCRQELIEKSQKRKILENLHDRKLSEYISENGRIEQAIADDTASQRHFRKIDLEE